MTDAPSSTGLHAQLRDIVYSVIVSRDTRTDDELDTGADLRIPVREVDRVTSTIIDQVLDRLAFDAHMVSQLAASRSQTIDTTAFIETYKRGGV